jgi:hypothetical protein
MQVELLNVAEVTSNTAESRFFFIYQRTGRCLWGYLSYQRNNSIGKDFRLPYARQDKGFSQVG